MAVSGWPMIGCVRVAHDWLNATDNPNQIMEDGSSPNSVAILLSQVLTIRYFLLFCLFVLLLFMIRVKSSMRFKILVLP